MHEKRLAKGRGLNQVTLNWQKSEFGLTNAHVQLLGGAEEE